MEKKRPRIQRELGIPSLGSKKSCVVSSVGGCRRRFDFRG